MPAFLKHTEPEVVVDYRLSHQTAAKLADSPSGGVVSELDISWYLILNKFRDAARSYGFEPVELTDFEDAVIYDRADIPNVWNLGAASGENQSKENLVLRTDPLLAILKLYHSSSSVRIRPISKWFTIAPTLKLNAKGQKVVEWQAVLMIAGSFLTVAEVQLMCAVLQLGKDLGLEESVQLDINHVGGVDAQKKYGDILKTHLRNRKYDLCDNCGERLSSDPFDILRCDQLGCQSLLSDGPMILDSLDQDSQNQFTQYLEALEELSIPYQLNSFYAGQKWASGLCINARAQIESGNVSFAEGFDLDLLSQKIFGKTVHAFAVVCNLSQLRRAIQPVQSFLSQEVYLAPLGDLAARKSLHLFRDLVSEGVTVCDYFGVSNMKNQLKNAVDRKGKIALIIGQREAVDEMVILRDLVSGIQEIFHFDQVVEEVKKRLGR
jgi:histidyl-tRNA synthetase